MEADLRHPSLNTHKISGMACGLGDVFESYVQNKAPDAYRIFWSYGTKKGEIVILDLDHHL